MVQKEEDYRPIAFMKTDAKTPTKILAYMIQWHMKKIILITKQSLLQGCKPFSIFKN